MFAILIVTLPTQPNAVRLRIWRSLKALGCAALRDGAYLLPLEQAGALEELATEVLQHGGTASVLTLSPRDEKQRLQLLAQFDRSEAFVAWRQTARALLGELDGLSETEASRRARGVADALQTLRRIDYYPGPAAEQAQAELAMLRRSLDLRFSRGEPQGIPGDVPRLDAAKFQRKRWATRARPWVDRLACAWLIRHFIDPVAKFVWLSEPLRPPRGVVGFDFDGARFTHVGNRVTFEVLMASFGLDQDPRLQPIAAAVHYLDAGGIAVPQAAGLEAVLAGLRELHANDDDLLRAAATMFDALYALPGASPVNAR
ncbi:MAG: chromate resistance protein [Rhodoferax sp.]|nr:chromate resistance protein [Rhodoferax sp.]